MPTITSDKSGFGQWILTSFNNNIESCGVKVIERNDSNYERFVKEAAREIKEFSLKDLKEKEEIKLKAAKTASSADWSFFIRHYDEAFKIALRNRDKRVGIYI